MALLGASPVVAFRRIALPPLRPALLTASLFAFLASFDELVIAMFLGGVNGRMFLLIATVLVAVFCVIIAFDDLRRERIFAYLDPWNPDRKSVV